MRKKARAVSKPRKKLAPISPPLEISRGPAKFVIPQADVLRMGAVFKDLVNHPGFEAFQTLVNEHISSAAQSMLDSEDPLLDLKYLKGWRDCAKSLFEQLHMLADVSSRVKQEKDEKDIGGFVRGMVRQSGSGASV